MVKYHICWPKIKQIGDVIYLDLFEVSQFFLKVFSFIE